MDLVEFGDLHPNKSYASSPDIDLGYSVTYVNIGQ